MAQIETGPPLVESVFHPTDFSEASHNAFAHALAIALFRQTQLTVMHADRDQVAEDQWTDFPAIRGTLERWGALKAGSARADVADKLGIRAKKVGVQSMRPLKAVVKYLKENPTDLIVVATEGKSGLQGWLREGAAEELAMETDTMTLFVPAGHEGFVAYQDGTLSLRRILIPVAASPDPRNAVIYAARAADSMGGKEPVEITLLHVGDAMPPVGRPEGARWTFREQLVGGDVNDAILGAIADLHPDLVVMSSEGRNSILDSVFGSTTERIVNECACPLLAVPANRAG